MVNKNNSSPERHCPDVNGDRNDQPPFPGSDEEDLRGQVAAKLRYISMWQMHKRRGRGSGRAPWADPRHGQGRVLALLAMKETMTQKELTYLLGMSRQGAAELISKLESKGLLKRTPSESDRRAMDISLTEEGAKARQEQKEQPSCEEQILDVLTEEELADLVSYLERITQKIEDLDPKFAKRVLCARTDFERGHGRFGHPHMGTRGFDGPHEGPLGFGRPGFRKHHCRMRHWH